MQKVEEDYLSWIVGFSSEVFLWLVLLKLLVLHLYVLEIVFVKKKDLRTIFTNNGLRLE